MNWIKLYWTVWAGTVGLVLVVRLTGMLHMLRPEVLLGAYIVTVFAVLFIIMGIVQHQLLARLRGLFPAEWAALTANPFMIGNRMTGLLFLHDPLPDYHVEQMRMVLRSLTISAVVTFGTIPMMAYVVLRAPGHVVPVTTVVQRGGAMLVVRLPTTPSEPAYQLRIAGSFEDVRREAIYEPVPEAQLRLWDDEAVGMQPAAHAVRLTLSDTQWQQLAMLRTTWCHVPPPDQPQLAPELLYEVGIRCHQGRAPRQLWLNALPSDLNMLIEALMLQQEAKS